MFNVLDDTNNNTNNILTQIVKKGFETSSHKKIYKILANYFLN